MPVVLSVVLYVLKCMCKGTHSPCASSGRALRQAQPPCPHPKNDLSGVSLDAGTVMQPDEAAGPSVYMNNLPSGKTAIFTDAREA
jgi:hypothetical protein